jgi:hypothetical protein
MEKNYNTLNNFLIFSRIVNFLGGSFEFEQAVFHFYLSFLDFLTQVIHFCKFDWTNLIETNLRFLQKKIINSSILTCFGKKHGQNKNPKNFHPN